jgi:hypothetical protein
MVCSNKITAAKVIAINITRHMPHVTTVNQNAFQKMNTTMPLQSTCEGVSTFQDFILSVTSRLRYTIMELVTLHLTSY